MKTRLLPLLLAAAALSACSITPGPPPAETRFVRDFSLGEAVAALGVPQLQGFHAGSSYEQSPGSTARYRRSFELVYHLDEAPGAPFNDPAFFAGLQGEIVKAARAAGVRLTGGGASTESIQFGYETPEGHVGSVDVFGTRAAGGQYKLWGVIHESIDRDPPS
jgi:hypothetical protein